MFSDAELEAYLDEALPVERMTAVEEALRRDPQLLSTLSGIHARRDAGVHGLGEIWRRNRLSCASRGQLGNYLLGILSDGEADYVRFHLETVGCRICQANLADLRSQHESAAAAEPRRRKYFHSSVGRLPAKT